MRKLLKELVMIRKTLQDIEFILESKFIEQYEVIIKHDENGKRIRIRNYYENPLGELRKRYKKRIEKPKTIYKQKKSTETTDQKIPLKDFLCSIMSEKEAKDFGYWLSIGQPIIVSGDERTSKSTLVHALRNVGYPIYEDFEPIHIYLRKQIPIEDCIPNLYNNISVSPGTFRKH